jgi:hypothetical protein
MEQDLEKQIEVGWVLKRGRSRFIVSKVNKRTITVRQFWDRAVRGTNRRRLILGDFYLIEFADLMNQELQTRVHNAKSI